MRHTISSSDLNGVFKYLIGASTGADGHKQLFIRTTITNGDAITDFTVDLRRETVFSASNLKEAIEKYNDL